MSIWRNKKIYCPEFETWAVNLGKGTTFLFVVIRLWNNLMKDGCRMGLGLYKSRWTQNGSHKKHVVIPLCHLSCFKSCWVLSYENGELYNDTLPFWSQNILFLWVLDETIKQVRQKIFHLRFWSVTFFAYGYVYLSDSTMS